MSIFRCVFAVLSALSLAPHAMAQSRPAQCLLEVKGVHHIGGACGFTPLDPSGSFRITDVQGRNLVAQVNVGKKDEGKAVWNGPLGGNAASAELGDAYRSGGCWILSDSDADRTNDSRICAWGLNEKVYLGPSPGEPDPTSTLFYGARVGMYDDIASRQGLDTASAIVTTKPSHDGAVQFCRDYSRDYSEKCIAAQMRESRGITIAGDCGAKTFSDSQGGKYKFLGKAGGAGDMSAEYSIRDLASGQILDGSTASGYDIMLGFYQALCPASAPKPQK